MADGIQTDTRRVCPLSGQSDGRDTKRNSPESMGGRMYLVGPKVEGLTTSRPTIPLPPRRKNGRCTRLVGPTKCPRPTPVT